MPKNKTLPKDFADLLKEGDLPKLKAVFDKCALTAVGGFSKETALAFDDCPDELARWLVEQGLDIESPDSRGATPLQSRSASWRGNIHGLIELGADVNRKGDKGTPLHFAAQAHRAANVKILLEHGADVRATDKNSMTPLEVALQRCTNGSIDQAAAVSELLLDAGAEKTARMPEFITRIGTNFEFQRANFNPDTRQQVSDALDHLYKLFDVPPVPGRKMHDGTSPIVAKGATWEARHEELWELLVPGNGAAPTVQGEVIRIGGRINRELNGNGGANWDAFFKQMADAWLEHVQAGTPLPADKLQKAIALIKEIKSRDGEPAEMCELSVAWVDLNPTPMPLAKPAYER